VKDSSHCVVPVEKFIDDLKSGKYDENYFGHVKEMTECDWRSTLDWIYKHAIQFFDMRQLFKEGLIENEIYHKLTDYTAESLRQVRIHESDDGNEWEHDAWDFLCIVLCAQQCITQGEEDDLSVYPRALGECEEEANAVDIQEVDPSNDVLEDVEDPEDSPYYDEESDEICVQAEFVGYKYL
jgi:hypothetical protein